MIASNRWIVVFLLNSYSEPRFLPGSSDLLMTWRFQIGFYVLLSTLIVISLNPELVASEVSSQADGMKIIREAVRQPSVKDNLKARGISGRDIQRRLAFLEKKLTVEEQNVLASRLTTDRKKDTENRADIPGDRFLGTTAEIMTTILLFPIKLLSWIIPGL